MTATTKSHLIPPKHGDRLKINIQMTCEFRQILFLHWKKVFQRHKKNKTISRNPFMPVGYLTYCERMWCNNSNIFYLPVQIYINARLAATRKNSPARVRFLPSLSIKSIVNNIPEQKIELTNRKWRCLFTEIRWLENSFLRVFLKHRETLSHSVKLHVKVVAYETSYWYMVNLTLVYYPPYSE